MIIFNVIVFWLYYKYKVVIKIVDSFRLRKIRSFKGWVGLLIMKIKCFVWSKEIYF